MACFKDRDVLNTSPEGHKPIRGHLELQKCNSSPKMSLSSILHCSFILLPENHRLVEKSDILIRSSQVTHERPPIGIMIGLNAHHKVAHKCPINFPY
mgnify:CR=1 FL=1